MRQAGHDPVNRPAHYVAGRKYEPIDVLEDWFMEDGLLWQVAKYISRAGRKDNAVRDLEKARYYLDRAIAREKRR
jgi:hypothetical protein